MAAVDGLLSLGSAEAGAWRPPVIRTGRPAASASTLADAVVVPPDARRRDRTPPPPRSQCAADLVASLFMGRVAATIGAGGSVARHG
jgi:hypothetical protein